ncbi:hypothetical protein KMW28_04085 [Flammeovirga yaeyamensis]|uniref:Outer membrane protein n=1 Tax=Flammeovirga yaeyamensis TaxID=367791 RepID=A0AAX1N9V6_9BACT|nr:MULTISPECIES: hypothetical protein [Flammeovirga]ANQ49804.2 hypothetical protein MY04_2432 [Flammeovirga sp. MY04]MBB3697334.1 hypothetical protein [Flammeovirga yaeyamensis]NMF36028.1 hypothetical protein [Flammeovirga yaeyamensis]QWG02763.1 hypothetical protein KMW28_04085 [Flammeovirga yaeyamensis]
MYKQINNIIISCLLLITFGSTVYAQQGNAPFTALGVGNPVPSTSARNQGMGYTGVGLASYGHSNLLNPATLTYNNLTLFEAGMYAEQRDLFSDSQTQQDYGGGLSYMTFAFPVSRKWTMGVGFKPYSVVSYKFYQTDTLYAPVNGSQIPTGFYGIQNEGKGGINQVYFSNGFKVSKWLSVGLELAYNVGVIEKVTKTELLNNTSDFISGRGVRLNYRGLMYKPGIYISKHFGPKDKGSRINFGGTYTFQQQIGVKRLEDIQTRSTSDLILNRDTIIVDDSQYATFPTELALGFSYEIVGKMAIAVDYTKQSWSEFEDYNGTKGLYDAFRLGVGIEYTPDYFSASSYWKRLTWRGGFRYGETPYQVYDEKIKEYVVTAGVEFPMGFSSLAVSGEYGWMRSDIQQASSFEDRHYRLNIGVTINDRWFVRRRIN